ncbi:Metallo-hydrolase/oxidoreductase [Dichomitus squalens]|uniref:Metallo-hydrolase/oxidoreductase n=1 Tax=Dichomitus squalens TaxID=114155 RepID=A0A4Q9MY77_9APHY|nr:Metallo-hydrolase/oxidoreductase [Dichomitus squalens]
MSTLSSVNITILGSASAQPSSTRNHSALALRLDGDVWLFDCGEATQHQIQKSSVKIGKVQKIFITHTHGDHIFGLLPLLAMRLNGAGGTVDIEDPRVTTAPSEDVPPLEIYGPLGTRAYVRTGLTYTHTLLGAPYVVHELRLPTDPADGDHTALPPHPHERPGRNILQAADGTWPAIFAGALVSVSAAPILHSVPCVGYVVAERPVPGKMDPARYLPDLKRTGTPMSAMRRLQQGESVALADGTVLRGPARKPGRKIVILGDTHDPSPIAGLAADACVLVHEATNAHLPGVDPDTKAGETYESVEARARSRGHSTPQMAGAFARRVRARKLVLNHFSARYAGNDDVDEEARRVMGAIRELAESTYGGEVVCARDLMSFDVGPRKE